MSATIVAAQPKPAPTILPAAAIIPFTEQVAPVLVSISRDAANVKHMTLQLQPDALGILQIQIDRAPNQPIQIRIEAERPETLSLLQRETPQLQHALDRAGVGRDIMTVTFHTAPPVGAVPAAQDTGQPSTQFMGTGQSHQGFTGGRPPPNPLPQTEAGNAPDRSSEDKIRTAIARSGLDIVA